MVSSNTISRLERGEHKEVQPLTLRAIAEALAAPTDEIEKEID